jgi:hypothetical protein
MKFSMSRLKRDQGSEISHSSLTVQFTGWVSDYLPGFLPVPFFRAKHGPAFACTDLGRPAFLRTGRPIFASGRT